MTRGAADTVLAPLPEVAPMARGPGPRIAHLDALRGFAIILVVGIHARGYAGPIADASRPTIEAIWTAVAGLAVPAFFLCDGYLFALAQERSRSRGYIDALNRNVRRLLWPWLVFTLLYTIFRAAGEAAGLFHDHLVLGRRPTEIAMEWWESRIAMQLYFLPALFLVRCLGPVFRTLTVGPAWPSVVAAGASFGLLPSLGIQLGGDPVTNALGGLRFFLMGIAAFRYGAMLVQHGRWILVVLAPFVLVLVFQRGQPVLALAYQFATLLVAHVACLIAAGSDGWLTWMGRQTMGIYLLHAPPLLKAVQMVIARVHIDWVARFLAIWLVTYLIAIGLTRLISRHKWGRLMLGES